MKIFIQTRGYGRDYGFLGATPAQPWWRKPYEEGTSFEKPTVIVQAQGPGQWRGYISGLPSRRRDRVSTPIRYTLVLEADPSSGSAEDAEKVLSLLQQALTTFSTQGTGSTLPTLLDEVFNETKVNIDELLANPGSPETAHTAENLLSTFLQKLPSATANTATNAHAPQGSWLGELDSPQATQAWMARIRDLLSGTQTGSAALLNLVDSQEYAEKDLLALMQDELPLALLISQSAKPLRNRLVPLAKPVPPPETRALAKTPKPSTANTKSSAVVTEPRKTSSTVPVAAAGVAIVVVVAVAVFFSKEPTETAVNQAETTTAGTEAPLLSSDTSTLTAGTHATAGETATPPVPVVLLKEFTIPPEGDSTTISGIIQTPAGAIPHSATIQIADQPPLMIPREKLQGPDENGHYRFSMEVPSQALRANASIKATATSGQP